MARRSSSLLHLGHWGYVKIADDVIIITPTKYAGTTLIYRGPHLVRRNRLGPHLLRSTELRPKINAF